MLHSGGRYAVKDQESARESIEENRILRKIAPGLIEENGGMFVGITDEDVEYGHTLSEGCAECGIPTKRLTPEEAFRLEPNLNPDTKLVLMVPDGSFDAMRLPLRFFATAKKNGAVLKPFTEVIGMLRSGDTITGVRVLDHRNMQEYDIHADIVINACGPWSGRVA
ncbi:MAG: FAD-dependent oxidoreductase, partial [Chloroflexota bacterium]